MALTVAQLEDVKQRLLRWRDELQKNLDQELSAITTQELEHLPDPNDQASQESERSFDMRIKGRERRLIKKINESLSSINHGRYGICAECGADISFKRLEARLVTTLCIECKTEQEHQERTRLT